MRYSRETDRTAQAPRPGARSGRRRARAGLPLLLGLALCVHCQHARVRVAPAITSTSVARPGAQTQTRTLSQHYFLFGFLPRNVELNESELCPGSTLRELDQYSSFTNLVFEQVTLGVYSPRTLEVHCQ